jgi:hypothetical protein
LARAFNATVLSGRLRKAVRKATSRDGGGVLQPDDACTKTGRPVIDVLREKHPKMRDPGTIDLDDNDRGVFEPYEAIPEAVPLSITADTVEKVAPKLSGSAGLGGTDAVDMRSWLLRFGTQSERLRHVLATFTEWLANEHSPWAAYRALMACRLAALDKEPGVRPVGIGEIYRRLFAKCVLEACGTQATDAAGNLNLCVGQPAGIEAAVHALMAPWEEPDPPEAESEGSNDDDIEPTSQLRTQPTDPSQDTGDDDEMEAATMGVTSSSRGDDDDAAELDDPVGALLVDARNGFNELSRKAMLWTVRHRWATGARFSFNCYRHASQLMCRHQGQPGIIILSAEGVTQGDPLSMVLYGLALVPLAHRLREAVPTARQTWYADDNAGLARARALARYMDLLMVYGPMRGYFPEPEKSVCIFDPADKAAAEGILGRFNFKYADGHRYVGGFMGSEAARQEWLQPKIQQWVDGV